jgi:hypothetical protein
MKSNFTRTLAIGTMALIAIFVSAKPASAQDAFKGSFTLPQDASWGGYVLPAGDYTFTLKSTTMPARITLEGPNGATFVSTVASVSKNDGDISKMTLVRRGNAHFVKDLYLAALNLHLIYATPSVPKSERMLAQGPDSTEQVLVAMAKN